MRNLAEKRHNDWVKAIRKRRIDRELKGTRNCRDWYDNLHQYSKNTIFCSCPMCRSKTSKLKMRKSGGPGGKNWPITDKKRIDEMKDQMLDTEDNF